MSNTRGRSLKRTVAGVSAGVLTLTGAAAALAVPAGAQSTFSFTRLAGTDRFSTAAAIATSSFTTSDTVIVASGRNFPDALAGNFLAGFKAAPILLVNTTSVPTATSNALTTLAAKNVIILGGTSAVSASVQATLAAKYSVTRVAGSNRYATAKAIAETTGVTIGTIGGVKTAVLASGLNFADALSAGPLGYGKQLPIEITDPAVLSADTKAAFTSLGIKNVIIVGGTAAVSAAVEAEVKALNGGTTTTRLAGTTRQLTAVAIANFEASNGFSASHVNLARGDDFADALAGGPHAGKELASILLTDSPAVLGAAATAYLTAHSNTLTSGNIFGGTAAVSDAVKTAGETAAKGTSAKSQTTRPELISAAITGTVTPATFNGTSPLGTTVTYTFDEAIASTPVGTSFKLYSASDVAVTGTFVSVVGSTVTIRFTGIDGTTDLNGTAPVAASNASRYSLAAVVALTVTDNQGQQNPAGAAAVGAASAATSATATANTTAAPDLRSVSGFRAVPASATTAVDFVFDQAAFVTTATTGYNLVLLNGTVVNCTGPLQGSTTPASGGTVAGGNGTTTITVVCATASNLTAADIARAYVTAGTVSDTLLHSATVATVTNPLESVNAGNSGLTTGPDLTSATFIPAGTGTNATALDQVLFKFDQAATGAATGPSTAFNVFHADSTQTSSTAVVQVNAASDQILVSFTAGTLTNAVGASNNAVFTAQAASVGVTPTAATTSGQTPGVVAAPQLASVALKSTTDVFNNTAFTATYTFTQAVGAGAPTGAAYRLYDSNGNTLSAPTCTVPTGATTTNTIVVCTAYTDAASAVAATVQADTGAATLGTVDAGAVTGTTVGFTGTNPEGAQATTGGTGTPAS